MEPTRQTFGNIPPSSQVLFYLLTVVAMAVFAYGVWRRIRLWLQGTPVDAVALVKGSLRQLAGRWQPGARRVLVDGLGQQRVRGRGAAGTAHILMFAGFMMLFLGTTMLEINHIAEMISASLGFHRGLYYQIYEFTLDVFGLLFLAGCVYFLWRRLRRKPASVGHRWTDWYVLGSLIAIGLTGYLLEALRIGWQQPVGAGAKCSPVGLWICATCFSSLSEASLRAAHQVVWWLHAVQVFGFIAAIPYTRLFHIIAGPLNLFFAGHALGVMRPVTMEEVERTERIGVSDIRHFTRQQLLSLDACMECGRCGDVCPAALAGQPLSPKQVVIDLRDWMTRTLSPGKSPQPPRKLHGETIGAETLWACTACSACVNVCPVRIDQLTLILDLRRHLVGDGELSGTAATALRRVQSSGNPWGLPATDRADWIETPNKPSQDAPPA